MKSFLLISLGLLLCTAGLQAQQGGAASPEARMREAMKKVMLQLRDSQAAQAAAVAAQQEAEAKNKDLTDKMADLQKKFDALVKQSAKDKETSDKVEDDLRKVITARDKEVAHLKEMLVKWQAHDKEAVSVANAKEKERAEAAGKVVVMERKVADAERKNLEMYRTGVEILDRYAKFGLGTALTAREPFIGTMRVKFQNWAQDYGDKLDTQRIEPKAKGTPSKAGAPATAKAEKAKPEN